MAAPHPRVFVVLLGEEDDDAAADAAPPQWRQSDIDLAIAASLAPSVAADAARHLAPKQAAVLVPADWTPPISRGAAAPVTAAPTSGNSSNSENKKKKGGKKRSAEDELTQPVHDLSAKLLLQRLRMIDESLHITNKKKSPSRSTLESAAALLTNTKSGTSLAAVLSSYTTSQLSKRAAAAASSSSSSDVGPRPMKKQKVEEVVEPAPAPAPPSSASSPLTAPTPPSKSALARQRRRERVAAFSSLVAHSSSTHSKLQAEQHEQALFEANLKAAQQPCDDDPTARACLICSDTFLPVHLFSCNTPAAVHELCCGCVREYWSTTLCKTGVVVPCVEPKCRGRLPLEALALVLPPREWEAAVTRSEERNREAALQHGVAQVVQCPCGAPPAVVEKGDVGNGKLTCPQCGQVYCIKCGDLYMNTKNLSSSSSSSSSVAALDSHMCVVRMPHELVKKGAARQCPNCGTLIEKNEGCNHMTCSNCKYEHCWLCGAERASGKIRTCHCP